MKIYNCIFFIMFCLIIGCKKTVPDRLLYIDAVKPSIKPLLFAKGFISKDSTAEFGSVFNEKGDEFYFATDSLKKAEIKFTAIKNGKWESPVTLLSHPKYSFNDPFLSRDETKLYFISDMPKNNTDTIADYDIWYCEKLGSTWSAPINAGSAINTDANEFYVSFTNDGSMYFSSNKENYQDRKHDFDIYKSVRSATGFETPQKLSDSINSGRYEADVFISPDESYIIYCSARRSGYGSGDLYISFKDDKNNWTPSVNMGETINSKGYEMCPFVSRDGKFFFYTSNQDIYWVSTKFFSLLKDLK